MREHTLPTDHLAEIAARVQAWERTQGIECSAPLAPANTAVDSSSVQAPPTLEEVVRQWTVLDECVGDAPADLAEEVKSSCLQYARSDCARAKRWHTPTTVEVIRNITYRDDHEWGRADLYLPREVRMRRGRRVPIYADIHGGGFFYGTKTLNGFFCSHLAAHGFAVFSLDYRLAPAATFTDQLSDIASALAWIKEHAWEWSLDADSILLAGDSAGATLALYATLIHSNEDAAAALLPNDPVAAIPIRATALVSGLFDVRSRFEPQPEGCDNGVMEKLSVGHFSAVKQYADTWFDLPYLAAHGQLPPLYLLTSDDDFLRADTLHLAAALADQSHDFQLADWYSPPGASLGHVFPMSYPDYGEGAEALASIARFSWRHLIR